MSALNSASLSMNNALWQDNTLGLIEAQSLAYYPNPYTVSPSYSMMQTPWYLDYGHLVFWFFFFSTFVIVMWLFYIYVSVAYNIESRRPIRETRGFSRAQVGDTMTAVLPLTWSITMLAHASTHSTNFDENTTATVFSFSVIAYQWGWNYYFPRDIVEVITGAPVLVGHKRVISLSANDPYAVLLAHAKHEYYSRLNNSNQLVAKHGKHVLNQYLQAAFVGSRITKDHAWFITNLTQSLDYSQLKVAQYSSAVSQGLNTINPDIALTLNKETPLSSTLLYAEFEGVRRNLLNFLQSGNGLLPFNVETLNLAKNSATTTGKFSSRYVSNLRTSLFDYSYNKPKVGTNPFRAHNTAVYVGNRLGRIYSHLSSPSSLPSELIIVEKQGFFIQNLLVNVGSTGLVNFVSPLAHSFLFRDTFLAKIPALTAENIGINLWLTRGFKDNTIGVVRPWLSAALQYLKSSHLIFVPNQLSIGLYPYSSINFKSLMLSNFNSMSTKISLNASFISKLPNLFWLMPESTFNAFTSKNGNMDFSKYSQFFFFSGEDLTLSGGESQRLQSSDLAWLSANAAAELSNRLKSTLNASEAMLLNKIQQPNSVNAAKRVFSLAARLNNSDLALVKLFASNKAVNGELNSLVGKNLYLNPILANQGLAHFSLNHVSLNSENNFFTTQALLRLDTLSAVGLSRKVSSVSTSVNEASWVINSTGLSTVESLWGLKLNNKINPLNVIDKQETKEMFNKFIDKKLNKLSSPCAHFTFVYDVELLTTGITSNDTLVSYVWYSAYIASTVSYKLTWLSNVNIIASNSTIRMLYPVETAIQTSYENCSISHLLTQHSQLINLSCLAFSYWQYRGAHWYYRMKLMFSIYEIPVNYSQALDQRLSPYGYITNFDGGILSLKGIAVLYSNINLNGSTDVMLRDLITFEKMSSADLFCVYTKNILADSIKPEYQAHSADFKSWNFLTLNTMHQYVAGLQKSANSFTGVCSLYSPESWIRTYPVSSLFNAVKTSVNASLYTLACIDRAISVESAYSGFTGLLGSLTGVFTWGYHLGQNIYLDYVYVPAYIHIKFRSVVYKNFVELLDKIDETLFFIDLGFAEFKHFIIYGSHLNLSFETQDKAKLDIMQLMYPELKNTAKNSTYPAFTVDTKTLAFAQTKCSNTSPVGEFKLPNAEGAAIKIKTDTNHAYWENIGINYNFKSSLVMSGVDNSAYALVSRISNIPSSDTHWLEGVSDLYPTRVSDVASNDIVFLNAKDLKSLDRSLLLNTPMMFDWWSRWSWEVLSANLPWDKLFRSWTAKRTQGNLLYSTLSADLAKKIELTELSRQRFDKNAVETLIPSFKKLSRVALFPELSPSTLDTEFGSAITVPAIVLPTPHLDVDPSFIFFNLTPEVNTSRRSDHDARYKVTWGPIAALNLSLDSDGTAANQAMPWPKKSGPQALSVSSPRLLQSSSVLSSIDLYTASSTSLLNYVKLGVQPKFGALFSDAIQAPSVLGLPTLKHSKAGILLVNLTNSLTTPENIFTPNSTYFDYELADFDSALNLLETGKRQIKVPTDSSTDSRVLSEWSSLWHIHVRSGKDVFAQAFNFGVDSIGLDVLRLLLAVNSKENAYYTFFWKHGKLTSLNLTSAVTSESIVQTVQDTVKSLYGRTDINLSGTYTPVEKKRTGYAAIQPGVSNMRRLRVTQGIYLPADLPIHGIFGSKDVIHSWAIPGLGVKVDCIPGYSSHRRLFFRWRGLFWGQCMEVCGRYHHWMPLLVRIVHKDIFIIWCLTYLRLLTSVTPFNSYTFSIENSQLAWDIAANAAQHPNELDFKESQVLALLNI
jgi:heme/copper-type cytochrome/quinol oxidase subunit 2